MPGCLVDFQSLKLQMDYCQHQQGQRSLFLQRQWDFPQHSKSTLLQKHHRMLCTTNFAVCCGIMDPEYHFANETQVLPRRNWQEKSSTAQICCQQHSSQAFQWPSVRTRVLCIKLGFLLKILNSENSLSARVFRSLAASDVEALQLIRQFHHQDTLFPSGNLLCTQERNL